MISLIQNTIENLKAHKIRVALTVFWIIVGISSILIVGSIGNGVKKQIEESALEMAEKEFAIEFTHNDESMRGFESFISPITQTDISLIKDISGVKKVKGNMQDTNYLYGTFKINDSEFYSDIYGFDENGNDEYKDSYELVYGRKINESDRNKNVIILNESGMFDSNIEPQKLLGKGVTFNGVTYEVIGIMRGIDSFDMFGGWNPLTYSSIIPKTTLDKLALMYEDFSVSHTGLSVEIIKGYDVDKISNSIISLLKQNHPNIEGSYSKIDSGFDMNEEIKNMKSSVDMFVLLVTAISMIVGGLGVMNIMYVSVIERKREIGIRRAIGATPKKIVVQFLSEATVITTFGCILGVIVGSLLIKSVGKYVPFDAIPSVSVYIQAIISSVLTGVIAGILPAIKASKVDPIEAIQG